MNRQLNSREEMLKRLVYAVHIICFFFAGVLGVRGLLAGRADDFALAVLLGTIAVLIRRTGKQRFEFQRLGQSFPLGKMDDRLSDGAKRKVENLLREFCQTDDWIRRQEIRRSLEELVQQEPLLIDAYGDELHRAHPAAFHSAHES